jgi:phosphopantetheinyl transferase (holo-ACP synthase)
MSLRDIGIKNNTAGKPCPDLAAKFKKLQPYISISLSHTSDYAIAFAVFQK